MDVSVCFTSLCFCAAVQARNGIGIEGLVPENYIRIWNPVDDVGENDMSEVSVDDDTQLDDHRLAASNSYQFNSYSDSEFAAGVLCSPTVMCFSLGIATHFVCVCLHTFTYNLHTSIILSFFSWGNVS